MQNTKALAKTHTLTYQDMQGVVQSNVQFYNDILASAQNFDFYYFTAWRMDKLCRCMQMDESKNGHALHQIA